MSFAHLRLVCFRALRWCLIASTVGVLAGVASAGLLHALDFATAYRESHLWLIALLPLAGFGMGWVYHRFGRSVERGNNLILEQIHEPGETIPLRMTPLVLFGTFATHLFGGSAGREGTAVQTGASLADQLARPLRLGPQARRLLLMSGVSAGFASVFGVPLAGTVFGMEVLALGTVTYEAIGPCLIASFIGNLVTSTLYLHHAHYLVTRVPPLRFEQVALAAIAGTLFGLVARVFAWATHTAGQLFQRRFRYPPMRPFVGGVLVSAAVLVTRTTRYIGLGTSTISAAFLTQLPLYAFAAKLLFTAVTLGSGFKGGEVTPLFFIGSTLGNALATVLPLPASLLAAMGLAAVFAGAANTPIASLLMGMELFGVEAGAYCGIACICSYLVSGHSGIYAAQRVLHPKYGAPVQGSLALQAKVEGLSPELPEN